MGPKRPGSLESGLRGSGRGVLAEWLPAGYSNDDFVNNLVRFVGEERLNLAITRPAAICNVYGLPTS
jgi:hypothetical protein